MGIGTDDRCTCGKIGMDPVDLRLRNLATLDQTEQEPYTSIGLKQCLIEGAKAFGWKEARALASQTGPIRKGVGMAGCVWSITGGPPTTVIVTLFQDGSVNLNMAAADQGTGTKTIMAMVVSRSWACRSTEFTSNTPIRPRPSMGSREAAAVTGRGLCSSGQDGGSRGQATSLGYCVRRTEAACQRTNPQSRECHSNEGSGSCQAPVRTEGPCGTTANRRVRTSRAHAGRESHSFLRCAVCGSGGEHSHRRNPGCPAYGCSR